MKKRYDFLIAALMLVVWICNNFLQPQDISEQSIYFRILLDCSIIGMSLYIIWKVVYYNREKNKEEIVISEKLE